MSARESEEGVTHKFVLTEREAFLLACDEEGRYPDFSQMLGTIFDLDDPEVFEGVDGSLSEGRIVLGYWNPAARDVDIHIPLEVTFLMGTRLREVFGNPTVRGTGDEYPHSEYLEGEKMKRSDAGYIEDLKRLRELIWEGNFGYAQSRQAKENPERREEYERLISRYPEAYSAFGDERKQEAFKRCEHSPYLEKMRRGLPDTDANQVHLRGLKRLRDKMLLMGLGYGGQGLGMMTHSLKTRYPRATEIFREEIRGQFGN